MDNQELLEIRVARLEAELNSVHARNQRVALEKAWEQSAVRVIGIVVLTYALMCLLFFLIGASNFMISAIVPTLGYYLSTLSLAALKQHWMKKQAKDD